ncbi:MAG: 3-dehydro-L-gulonate 2-dehydrogenase [Bacteroidales bacterium]|nr:3-dehydro-L-gulonate 2-dehydrogenase [Bacteroidales bacterium]
MSDKLLISPNVMKAEFVRVLLSIGFSAGKAEKCAEIFTQNSVEGIYSHGVNRFPRFVGNTTDGFVKPETEPVLLMHTGSLEQWDGQLGPGPLNAVFATERAMDLADKGSIGMVTLANTNHWMRGGTYGWQAAKKGYVFIGWTNTIANMPAWGAVDQHLGNNPFVLAVPYKNEAIVLDMAMSQFSYGKMEMYEQEGRNLPCFGGYNKQGKLTVKPGEVLESWRPVPIGYWKGAGFSLLLDILATVLSGGLATHEISKRQTEYSISQVFMAIRIGSLSNFPMIENTIQGILSDYKLSVPEEPGTQIRYPGESIVETRNRNIRDGIPVNKDVWETILKL